MACLLSCSQSAEYQKYIIESLARSERAMKKKYYALQHAIESQISQPSWSNPTISTMVHVTSSRGITSTAASTTPDARVPDESPPVIRPQTLVAELLLCFQLLNDLLGYQMLVMRGELHSPIDTTKFKVL